MSNLSLAKSRAIHSLLSSKHVAFVCATQQNIVEAMRQMVANLPLGAVANRSQGNITLNGGKIDFILASNSPSYIGKRFDHAYSDETVPADIQWCVVVRAYGEPA